MLYKALKADDYVAIVSCNYCHLTSPEFERYWCEITEDYLVRLPKSHQYQHRCIFNNFNEIKKRAVTEVEFKSVIELKEIFPDIESQLRFSETLRSKTCARTSWIARNKGGRKPGKCSLE